MLTVTCSRSNCDGSYCEYLCEYVAVFPHLNTVKFIILGAISISTIISGVEYFVKKLFSAITKLWQSSHDNFCRATLYGTFWIGAVYDLCTDCWSVYAFYTRTNLTHWNSADQKVTFWRYKGKKLRSTNKFYSTAISDIQLMPLIIINHGYHSFEG